MAISLPEKDYTRRRGELSTYGRSVLASAALKNLLMIWVALAVGLLLAGLYMIPVAGSGARIAVTAAIAAILCGGLWIWKYTHVNMIQPDLAFRKWLQQICDGDLNTAIALPSSHRHYKELNFHSRNIATALRQLSTDMESLVDTQTKRLENQNRVLELLFKLTTDVAGEIDQQSVLDTVCTYLGNWLGDTPVAAYMQIDQQLKLQSSNHSDYFAQHLAATELVAGVQCVAAGADNGSRLRIPVFKGGKVTGMIEVIGNADTDFGSRESQQVFKAVSEQLSVFVARHSVQESVHHARMIKERIQLGEEIHDSLAQTLLASRYQITMLREVLERDPAACVYKDVLRVEGMIDEANIEVRELIGEYRKTPGVGRCADSIQGTIDELRKSHDIPVFFQNDNPHMRFTAREEATVQRIVHESLVNANKYSQAEMIRVYLSVEPSGVRSVLIEDDGVGFCTENLPQHNDDTMGEHIGLSIMRDRALSIGAILTIDSEPAEGTRISLKLPPLVNIDEEHS